MHLLQRAKKQPLSRPWPRTCAVTTARAAMTWFVLSHFPTDKDMQLLKSPMSRDAYMASVQPMEKAFDLGLKPLTHANACVQVQGVLEMHFSSSVDVVLSASVGGGGTCLCDCDDSGVHRVIVAAPKGRSRLTIYGKEAHSLGSLHGCFEYVLENTKGSSKNGLPISYGVWGERGHQFFEPLQGALAPNRSQRFALKAPSFSNLHVFFTEGKQWFPMEKQRDGKWTCQVELPGGGDVTILAKKELIDKSYSPAYDVCCNSYSHLLRFSVSSSDEPNAKPLAGAAAAMARGLKSKNASHSRGNEGEAQQVAAKLRSRGNSASACEGLSVGGGQTLKAKRTGGKKSDAKGRRAASCSRLSDEYRCHRRHGRDEAQVCSDKVGRELGVFSLMHSLSNQSSTPEYESQLLKSKPRAQNQKFWAEFGIVA